MVPRKSAHRDGLTALSVLLGRRWGLLLAVVAAALLGFAARTAYVEHGYISFNSDEAIRCHCLEAMDSPEALADDLEGCRSWFGIYPWLCSALYGWGGDRSFIPYYSAGLNVLLHLLWSWVVVRRTGRPWACLPFLAFLIFPPPAISYWGVTFCEFRMSYFYGAWLVLLAGSWFKDTARAIGFGILCSLGIWDDLLTTFFVVPVLAYECWTWVGAGPRTLALRGGAVLLGIAWVPIVGLDRWYWGGQFTGGQLKSGISTTTDWIDHSRLLLEAWPTYWLGGIPFGYLQDSPLGRSLFPPLEQASWPSVTVVLWLLWALAILGAALSLRGGRSGREALLWFGPPVLYLLFFIFGRQTWDALTFRYLAVFQVLPALFLGLWSTADGRQNGRRMAWGVLAVWIGLHAWMGYEALQGPPREHPAKRIVHRLQEHGYGQGFGNYWVSEAVRHFSKGSVLLTPYNHNPISRKAFLAARNSERTALVWVQGLDRPEHLREIARQLEELGFRPGPVLDFAGEGWSIIGWQKKGR